MRSQIFNIFLVAIMWGQPTHELTYMQKYTVAGCPLPFSFIPNLCTLLWLSHHPWQHLQVVLSVSESPLPSSINLHLHTMLDPISIIFTFNALNVSQSTLLDNQADCIYLKQYKQCHVLCIFLPSNTTNPISIKSHAPLINTNDDTEWK